VTLQHYGNRLTDALAWMPGWVAATALVAAVALLAWRALRQMDTTAEPALAPQEESILVNEEYRSEYQDA
jgi:hypothetical protein